MKPQGRTGLTFKAMLVPALLALLGGCASEPEITQDCGRLSAYLEPPKSDKLYRALVTHIDGRPVISQPNYKLAPGDYQLTVVELIHAPGMDVPLTARKSKTFNVSLAAGKRMHLAAEYLPEGEGEGFWQPVVWQIDDARCTLPKSDN